MTIPLTPTEQRLFDLLSDGGPHTKDQLVKVVDADGLVEWGSVKVHISNIRVKIRAGGLEIVSRGGGPAVTYQLYRSFQPEEVVG